MAAEGIESLAVCFLWSFMNSSHERAVRDLIEKRFPGIFVTLSSRGCAAVRRVREDRHDGDKRLAWPDPKALHGTARGKLAVGRS